MTTELPLEPMTTGQKIGWGILLIVVIWVLYLGSLQMNERAQIQKDAKQFCIDNGFNTGKRLWEDISIYKFSNEIVCEGPKVMCSGDHNGPAKLCGMVEMKKSYFVDLGA